MMDDIEKLRNALKGIIPNELQLLVVVVVIILLYETVKTLLPEVVKSIISWFRNLINNKRDDFIIDSKIRQFAIEQSETNWIFALHTVSQFNTIVGLQEIFELPSLSRYLNDNANGESLRDILKENESLAIIAGPGNGKSSLIKYLAHQYANETLSSNVGLDDVRIPIILNLGGIRSFDQGLPEVISGYYSDRGCEIPLKFIKKQLEEKRVIILLDALDEISDRHNRKNAVQWFLNIKANYKGNRFVITCRDVDWQIFKIPNIQEYRVGFHSKESCIKLVENWKKKLPDAHHNKIDGLIRRIEQDDVNLAPIWKNPLMLTISLFLHANGIKSTNTRTGLYKTFFNVLIAEWQVTKPNVDSVKTKKRADNHFKILKELAFYLISNIDKHDTIDLSDNHTLKHFINQIPLPSENDDYETLLNDICLNGILSTKQPGIYFFTNRAFLEYLSAEKVKDKGGLDWIVANYDKESAFETIINFLELHCKEGLPDQFYHVEKNSTTPMLKRIFSELYVLGLFSDSLIEAAEENILDHIDSVITSSTIDQKLIQNLFRINKSIFVNKTIDLIHNRKSVNAIRALTVVMDAEIAQLLTQSISDLNEECLKEFFNQARYHDYTDILLWEKSIDQKWKTIVCNSLEAKPNKSFVVAQEIVEGRHRRFVSLDYKKAAIGVIYNLNYSQAKAFINTNLKYLQTEVIAHLDKISNGEYRNLILKLQPTHTSLISKRVFDLSFAFVVLSLGLPIFISIYLMVRLTSRGPALYKQYRIMNGRSFYTYKFRTMRVDIEIARQTAARYDSRITKLGAFLRKTDLDELPNFINVLAGKMSVVGLQSSRFNKAPLEEYENFVITEVLKNHKAGIITWSNVNGYYDLSDEALQLKLNLYYCSKASVLFDLRLIGMAIVKLIKSDEHAF